MKLRLISLFLLTTLLNSVLMAQTKTDKGELIYKTSLEPYHHVILENDYITLMRVMIPAGVETYYHEQHLDYVNTHINGSKVHISYTDRPSIDHEMKSGNVKFGAHQGKSTIDKVKNLDNHTNHQVAFEIKQTGPQYFGGAERPAVEAFKKVLEERTVKGWKVTLKSGISTGKYIQNGPGVRVFFTEGRILISDSKIPNHVTEFWVHKGDAFYIEPGTYQLINGGDTDIEYNDYELL